MRPSPVFRDGGSFDFDVVLLHEPRELGLFLRDETRQLLGCAWGNLRTLLGEALRALQVESRRSPCLDEKIALAQRLLTITAPR